MTLPIHPIEGDQVDGAAVRKVWSTGKVELDGRSPVHLDDLRFVAGCESHAAFTVAPRQNDSSQEVQ